MHIDIYITLACFAYCNKLVHSELMKYTSIGVSSYTPLKNIAM